MNDTILIQQCYPGMGYEKMIELTKPRNISYCNQWKMDYQVQIDAVVPEWPPEVGGWAKLELIRRALEQGYQYVIWLDADALIYDLQTDLREACPRGIGACYHRIPQLHHWNVGVMYLQGMPGMLKFIEDWIACYPGDGDGWNEQGVFNRLGRKSKLVHTVSDKWNATLNVNMVPDAVVLGYHGCGNAQQRFDLMKQTLEIQTQKAQSG